MVVRPSPIYLISWALSNMETIPPKGTKKRAIPRSPSDNSSVDFTSGILVIQKAIKTLKIKNVNPMLK